MTEAEDRIRKLMKQPIELQMIKLWAVAQNLMDNLNIQNHVNAHRCQFGVRGSQGLAKVSACPKLTELKRRYMENIAAYQKIIGELDAEFKKQISGI